MELGYGLVNFGIKVTVCIAMSVQCGFVYCLILIAVVVEWGCKADLWDPCLKNPTCTVADPKYSALNLSSCPHFEYSISWSGSMWLDLRSIDLKSFLRILYILRLELSIALPMLHCCDSVEQSLWVARYRGFISSRRALWPSRFVSSISKGILTLMLTMVM